jgi:hypothetical protein
MGLLSTHADISRKRTSGTIGGKLRDKARALPQLALRPNLHDLNLRNGICIVRRAECLLIDALTVSVVAIKPIYHHSSRPPPMRPDEGVTLRRADEPHQPFSCRVGAAILSRYFPG